jgi:hypothetical protein
MADTPDGTRPLFFIPDGDLLVPELIALSPWATPCAESSSAGSPPGRSTCSGPRHSASCLRTH